MIEDEPERPEADIAAEVEAEPVEEPREKSPWKAFILTGLIASVIGAAGGGYGVYAGLKHFAPEPAAQAQVDLSPLEAKLVSLSDRLNAAENSLEAVKSRPDATPAAEPIDLSAIEARLEALESAPSPEIDADALAALQSAQEDGFEWPDVSALEARLAELETTSLSAAEAELPKDLTERLSALETNFENLQSGPAEADLIEDVLSSLDTRLEALENRPAPQPVVERVSILAFPKNRMIEAIEANQTGGLIEKTLSRHIRVKDENDPLTLIEGIEADMSEGRLAAATEKFDRLPSPVRAAGQAWYDSVKASL